MTSKCACGKEGENLKKCGRCSSVSYCSRDCQLRHWKQQHKKLCGKPKLRFQLGDRVKCNMSRGYDCWESTWVSGTIIDLWPTGAPNNSPYGILCDNFGMTTAPEDDDRTIQLISPPPRNEMHDKALFEEPPVDDECPVCCMRFPIENDTAYLPCCGQVICAACLDMARASGKKFCCPFCRQDLGSFSDAEAARRVEQRMETGDACACHMLANAYDKGTFGKPQDSTKAHELWDRSAALGSRDAHFNLYMSYSEYYEERGVKKDMTKAIYHLEMAAVLGDPRSRCLLGRYESEIGNYDRAKRHWLISASAGCDNCMEGRIKVGWTKGCVTEEEYQKALSAYRTSVDEIESSQRDATRAVRMRRDPSYGQVGPGFRDSSSKGGSRSYGIGS
ncbi:hypothetical protein ACHAXT_004140 [Thalassiosira profunda]